MKVFAKRSPWEPVRSYREEYRREMACQIVHDSLHRRPGWTEWYTLSLGDKAVGYGAVAVGGPWKGTRTAFEFYVSPPHRPALVDLFDSFISAAHAVEVSAQTNDAQLCVGLHQRCRDIQAEALVFRDGLETSLKVPGARVRKRAENEAVFEHKVEPVGDYAVEFEGEVVATGGYLTHYNPPFVDIFMEVRPNMRRRGFGALLVQGIKRAAHEAKLMPCARCNLDNVGSRRALARAGMIPCAHIVRGKILGV
jgi:GNAT superfamily N-acetyltransferase